MIIEIKGVQFVNKGAELMLCAIVQKITCFWPEAQIVLAPNENSSYLERANYSAWQKLSIRKYPFDFNRIAKYLPVKVRQWLKKWGIVTEADIDVVLDASGFAYGDQWNPVLLQHALAEAKRMHDAGKKYIFLPQAFGPFTREKSKKLVKEQMKFASLVCAREETSFSHILDLMGKTDNLKTFPDFTNALVGELPDYYQAENFQVCLIPNHNMISDKNPNSAWKHSYIDLFCATANYVQSKGLSVYILNHEGKEDMQICHQINAQLEQPLPIISETDPIKVKGLIGGADMIVCSRFHGCVSALSQNTPCLGTSWSHKYEQLFSEYGVSECLLSAEFKDNELFELVDSCLTKQSDISKALATQSEHYKNVTETMWAEVKKVVEVNG